MSERYEGKVRLISKYRRPGGLWRIVTIGFPAATMALVVVHSFRLSPFGFVMLPIGYLYAVMAGILPLVFLWVPAKKSLAAEPRIPWYDIILAALSCVISLWFMAHAYEIWALGWEGNAPPLPYAMGTILMFTLFEAARRSAGPIFALTIVVVAFYPLFSSEVPFRILWGPGMSFHKLVSKQILSVLGIMGITMRVFGDIVIGFMVFAVSIQACGAGVFFTDLAHSLVGRTRAGNAKVAVVASAMFGTISGSAMANVMTTGAFTIPAMKKEGFPPEFAGGVEATVSSAGGITPPVMGSVAFIMSEFIGVPYPDICIVAAVPAALFYLCVYTQIDTYAARIEIKRPELATKPPPIWKALAKNYHIVFGIVSLVFFLLGMRWVSQAPWIATGITVGLAMVQKHTRMHFNDFVRLMESVGRTLSEMCAVLSSLGMIIGAMTFTGVAMSIPREIVRAAGGNILAILIIGAIANMILGMGLIVTAVYIFLALVLAPGLVALGLNILAVHFYIVYIGEFSNTTPPVALAAYTAASVAEADYLKTCWQAMKLGMAKYILPFMFVMSPALILQAPLDQILWDISTAAIGFIIIGSAIEGYFWFLGSITMVTRVILFAAGFVAVLPAGIFGPAISLYGIGFFAGFYLLAQLLKRTGNPIGKYVLCGR